MASWSDRAIPRHYQQLSGSSYAPPPVEDTSRNKNHNPSVRFADTSWVAEYENLDSSQIQATSSSSDEYDRPSRPSRPRHGRSMSNPFPSLFSGKKRKTGRSTAEQSEPDSSDEIACGSTSNPKLQQTRLSRMGHPTARDFATGKCMTCASLVRWPRELSVFRCTICSTINDLHPFPHSGEMGERTGGRMTSGQAEPISLERTRAIINQCIQAYLCFELSEKESVINVGDLREHVPASQNCYSTGGEFADDLQHTRPIPTVKVSQRPIEDDLGDPRGGLCTDSVTPRPLSVSYPQRRHSVRHNPSRKDSCQASSPSTKSEGVQPRIFQQLEDYIVASFTSYQCLNTSFSTRGYTPWLVPDKEHDRHRPSVPSNERHPVAEPDAKLLLLGDFAENGAWWTGDQHEQRPLKAASRGTIRRPSVILKTPYIDWDKLEKWYEAVVNCGESWLAVYEEMTTNEQFSTRTDIELQMLEAVILAAQSHVGRALLKATETLLKRPGRPLTCPADLRFLLIILCNPLFRSSCRVFRGKYTHHAGVPGYNSQSSQGQGTVSGGHAGIIKRILGLLSNLPENCHTHLVAWFSRLPKAQFIQIKDLVASFLTYRLMRQSQKKQEKEVDVTGGLVPDMVAGTSAASLHQVLGDRHSRSNKTQQEKHRKTRYSDDWQIRAAAQVMALIFAANNSTCSGRNLSKIYDDSPNAFVSAKDGVRARGQILPTSDFYAPLLDYSDLLADFETWESRRGRFTFCQYPFLLTIGAKIKILEHDARRQMQTKARDAFFDSIMSRRAIEQYLHLTVRRDCLVEDSLKAVSEVIGSGSEEIKKGLRIVFKGEEGFDAGGLRKEWFLLLVREVFSPDHGLFIYDEDSGYCYFNPNSFETSDQFFLVGVVLGLAIYNSTILDVALPPFAFRKLLLAAPSSLTPSPPSNTTKPAMTYTLDDLAEYRPLLAKGLRQLLEYDGDDVESTFCLDFAVDIEKYGSVDRVPLCPGGEKRAVTKANRHEYVELYVRYLLDTAVARQFEPFKRGFFTVCGGNALSLFRPEEIELLVRGSDEPLDIAALQAAADYANWRCKEPAETEDTVRWFWQTFREASPADQRRLLLFITGSDRIPATGAASLSLRIACCGDDCGRYPTTHTCFNALDLYRCKSRERLDELLWTAVRESEGFGLK